MAKSTASKVATGVVMAPFELLNIMFGTARGMSLPKIFFGNFFSLFIALAFLWNPTQYSISLWAKTIALKEQWQEEIWRGYWMYPESYSLEAWVMFFIAGAVILFIGSHLTTSFRNAGVLGKVLIAAALLPLYMGLGAAGIIDISDETSVKWLLVVGVPMVTAVSLTWNIHRKRRLGTVQTEDADTD